MKRNLLENLIAWKSKDDRKPLILRGARQTGKTYLLESFGRDYFPRYHIINFEKQEHVCKLFEADLEPKRLIQELRFVLETDINSETDLLIFDEIQACPRALTSLKYFCEEMPELALCAAGSLLGLHLNEGSYPVGKVDMLHLFPMTFSEFLEGVGDTHAASYLQAYAHKNDISDIAHQHLWQRLKHYFVTGGLPEIVKLFAKLQENLFEAVQQVRIKQNELINAYYADIAKHAGKINAMHIDRTWRSVPTQLLQTLDNNAPKFKFNDVLPNIRSYSQLTNVIDWLYAAELIIKVPIIETVRMPLSAFVKENRFKLFMFDIGILGAMSGLAPKIILDYDYGSYQGSFAENFVIQQLIATSHQHLVSWQQGRSEVEFLLSFDARVVPLEVKSGTTTQAKSLKKFIEKYQPSRSIILSAKPLQCLPERLVWHIPLYLSDQLKHLIR